MNLARLVATRLFLIQAALLLVGCERDEPSRKVAAQGETARRGETARVAAGLAGIGT
jgi:hypothetical protein